MDDNENNEYNNEVDDFEEMEHSLNMKCIERNSTDKGENEIEIDKYNFPLTFEKTNIKSEGDLNDLHFSLHKELEEKWEFIEKSKKNFNIDKVKYESNKMNKSVKLNQFKNWKSLIENSKKKYKLQKESEKNSEDTFVNFVNSKKIELRKLSNSIEHKPSPMKIIDVKKFINYEYNKNTNNDENKNTNLKPKFKYLNNSNENRIYNRYARRSNRIYNKIKYIYKILSEKNKDDEYLKQIEEKFNTQSKSKYNNIFCNDLFYSLSSNAKKSLTNLMRYSFQTQFNENQRLLSKLFINNDEHKNPIQLREFVLKGTKAIDCSEKQKTHLQKWISIKTPMVSKLYGKNDFTSIDNNINQIKSPKLYKFLLK